MPLIASAQTPTTFAGLVGIFLDIISILILVLFGLTLIVFLWGLVRGWILGAGDPASIEKGKQTALWGVVGLVTTGALWGIVALIKGGVFGF